MLETSIALAVAAIPEGCPSFPPLALVFGMLRMARHQVIVKKLVIGGNPRKLTYPATDKVRDTYTEQN